MFSNRHGEFTTDIDPHEKDLEQVLSINPPRWPVLRCSDQRLKELHAEASVAERNPFLALTTQVKLMASGGFFSTAQKLLRLVESEYPVISIESGMVVRLITAAIVAHDPNLAVSWLNAWLSPPYQIVIEPDTSSFPPAVVQLLVKGNTAHFQFSHGLFNAATAEMLIGRWLIVFKLFDAFMRSPFRIDGSVAISLDDGGSKPGLAFCDYRPGYYLIPDPHYVTQGQYDEMRRDFRSNPVAWDDRAPVAFWRGSTTGQPTDPATGWRSLPRVRLCEIAAETPTIIDAGITNITQIYSADALGELEARKLLRSRSPRRVFLNYRYQIDIDGNTSSWDGLFMKLLTGGPVLKVASRLGFEQWYYDRLKPWVNFVPVDKDMLDLADKVAWLRANDDAARKIGEAGRDLAGMLTDEQELTRVAPVIAAAIRADAGGPLIDLRFGAEAPDNVALRSGWLEVTPDGVLAAASNLLVLSKPPGLGDYVLMADITSADPQPQRMTIVAGNQLVLQRSIAGRTTVYCLLPGPIAKANEMLSLTLGFPDRAIELSHTGSIDYRPVGVTLHRIGVASAYRPAWDGYSDIAALLADLNDGLPSSVAHDLGWHGRQRTRLVVPSGAKPRTVYTFFGTILYADREAGRIRHGRSDEVPHNLFLFHRGDAAILARSDGDGGYIAVSLRPEGPQAQGDNWTPWTGGGLARCLTMTAMSGTEDQVFGLRAAGLFACAEENGEFTLSRARFGQWERLTFRPEGTG